MNPDDLLKSSPHEAFSLMLLERLERLEDAHKALQDAHRALQDEHQALQANLRFKMPHEWYKITMKLQVDAGDDALYYTNARISWINDLFSQRAVYHPTFAFWNWFIEGTMDDDGHSDWFHLHAYIRFQNPLSIEALEYFLGTMRDITITPFPGGVAELKMILTDYAYYHQPDFFHSTDDYGADMWRRGGEAFDAPATKEWTLGKFLDSPEYRPPSAPDRQAFLDYLRLTIQQRRWMALFQEEI